MWKWTQSILWSLPAAIGIEVVVQGILQSVPFDNTPLIESINNISPIGAALLPWLLYGISIFYAFVILNYPRKWFIDRNERGPEKRAFSSLYSDIQHCKSQWFLYNESFSQYQANQTSQTSALSNIVTLISLLDKLRIELRKINIDIPSLNLSVPQHRLSVVGFLSILEVYASSGDVDRARVAVRDFKQVIGRLKVDR